MSFSVLTLEKCRKNSPLQAQRRCQCPIPGGVQGQTGCRFEQPGLVGGVSLSKAGELELDL